MYTAEIEQASFDSLGTKKFVLPSTIYQTRFQDFLYPPLHEFRLYTFT